MDAVAVKIPFGWRTLENGKKIKLFDFSDRSKKLADPIQYLLKEERLSGVDYYFSFDLILKKITRKINSGSDILVVHDCSAHHSKTKEGIWMGINANTKVALYSKHKELIYEEGVSGNGQKIENKDKVATDPKTAQEDGPKQKINYREVEKNEMFNVYVVNAGAEWEVSNFQKNGQSYGVKKLKFKRVDGKDGVLHHNVHFDDRMGGALKQMNSDFDETIADALDNLSGPDDKIIITNVTYTRWQAPGASVGRDWIAPTLNTKIEIKRGKPAPAMVESVNIVDKILFEGRAALL